MKIEYADELAKFITKIPGADVVPVVRCKDCKYWDMDWEPVNAPKGDHFCSQIGLCAEGEWFCADGERREE